MLVDAHGDDEQLTALAEGISEALDFPLDVFVVGEPLSLLAVDYRGKHTSRSSPAAVRQDGTEYGVSLSDPRHTEAERVEDSVPFVSAATRSPATEGAAATRPVGCRSGYAATSNLEQTAEGQSSSPSPIISPAYVGGPTLLARVTCSQPGKLLSLAGR